MRHVRWPKRILSSREIVQGVSHSLVLIVTQDKEGEPVAQGSGFFFKDGLVATNLHVFKRASQGYVKIVNQPLTYKVDEIVAIDMQHDLCVFKVLGGSKQESKQRKANPVLEAMNQEADKLLRQSGESTVESSIPSLPLGSSKNVAVGDEVYVASNPKGLEGTFSKGIISSIRSQQGLIQIDAAISAGSSRGPVINNRGEVIGIAVASIVEGQNLNFAIPVEYLAILPHKWRVPVFVAGSLALKDREKEKLDGLVRTMITKRAFYQYNKYTDRYVEGPMEIVKSVTYDYEGNLIEKITYKGGIVVVKERYEYNAQGFKTRRSLTGKWVNTTDEAVTEIDSLNEKVNDRRFSTTDEMTADKDGKKDIITYDRYGNETEWIWNAKDGSHKTTGIYDMQGKVTEGRDYLNGVLLLIYRYTYELDRKDNWTKQLSTSYSPQYPDVGFTPGEVTYREITYYDN